MISVIVKGLCSGRPFLAAFEVRSKGASRRGLSELLFGIPLSERMEVASSGHKGTSQWETAPPGNGPWASPSPRPEVLPMGTPACPELSGVELKPHTQLWGLWSRDRDSTDALTSSRLQLMLLVQSNGVEHLLCARHWPRHEGCKDT